MAEILKRKRLVDFDFTSRHLAKADFSASDLRGAKFENSIVSGSNFTEANLQRADFTNADLRDCNLDGADLSDAIFAGAKGVIPAGKDRRGHLFIGVLFNGFLQIKGGCCRWFTLSEAKIHWNERNYKSNGDIVEIKGLISQIELNAIKLGWKL